MKNIRAINEADYEAVSGFLKRIPGIKEIDLTILANASIIIIDEEIKGVISFEQFQKQALIRYFIFGKQADREDIVAMFDCLCTNAKNLQIKQLIAMVDKPELEELFLLLTFAKSNKVLYFDERRMSKTDISILVYQIT